MKPLYFNDISFKMTTIIVDIMSSFIRELSSEYYNKNIVSCNLHTVGCNVRYDRLDNKDIIII